MPKKLVVVVDMQKDFIDGALGTDEAPKIIERCDYRIRKAVEDGDIVVFTRDTHGDDYDETEEGKNLPVPHCIKGTPGWQIVPELQNLAPNAPVIDKETFGSRNLGELAAELVYKGDIDEVLLFGLCTDICVISNAFIIKAFCPNLPIYVDASCCAGVTPASHEGAVKAMETCHIHVIGKGVEPWR